MVVCGGHTLLARCVIGVAMSGALVADGGTRWSGEHSTTVVFGAMQCGFIAMHYIFEEEKIEYGVGVWRDGVPRHGAVFDSIFRAQFWQLECVCRYIYDSV